MPLVLDRNVPTSMQQTVQNPAVEIARFVSTLGYEDLPDQAIRTVERAMVDTIGVMLAGAPGRAPTIADGAIRQLAGGTGIATLLPSGELGPVHDAAFVNGTAGHWHDYDDVMEKFHMHPSVPLTATVLAVGEQVDASARDLITAFAAGFEVIHYIAAPINPDHYQRGWHGTATYGTFSSTAAAASLLELTDHQLVHAMNIAGSLPAGLKRNFGSMTKSMHAGNAARNGILAAAIALDGFEATGDALIGDAGFYDLYRGEPDPDYSAFTALGTTWSLVKDGVDMKKYPCCYFTHAAIEATLSLIEEHQISPDSIDSVTVRASAAAKSAVIHDQPSTPLEGKFSMPYIIASAVVDGTVNLDTFTAAQLDNSTVRDFMERISFERDPDMPFSSHAGDVTITLNDGTAVNHQEALPPGVNENPLTETELESKFHECATILVSDSTASALFATINQLRDQNSVTDLIEPIATGRSS